MEEELIRLVEKSKEFNSGMKQIQNTINGLKENQVVQEMIKREYPVEQEVVKM